MSHTGTPVAGAQPRLPRRRRHLAAVVALTCLALSAATPAEPASAAVTTGTITYPYTCTTTFAGGASFTGDVQVSVTDLVNQPGVHRYPGGPVATQVQVTLTVSPAAVTALLGTGTTDWTSSTARLEWGGVTAPNASFSWHVFDSPERSDRFPISFTTAPFLLPGAGDVAPGPLAWDFQANAGTPAAFATGHTQCAPVPPVQVYATFLAAGGPSCAHQGEDWTCRWSYTGSSELWRVPADVRQVTLEVRGAAGATAVPDIDIDRIWPGGRGGLSSATVPVTPGEYLRITVGGTDGFNGGGVGAFAGLSGGGASDVRRAPFELDRRLVVAGGGGGGGLDVFCISGCPDHSGGAGGGLSGVGAGGGAGTQTSGGAPQATGDPAFPATAGSWGFGGEGATGGGGGYFGGGGGTASPGLGEVDGGGGGSGFVPAGEDSTTRAGASSGDGWVSIRYTSATTPYTSRYRVDEVEWLLADQRALHRSDPADAQHDAAMFMTLVAAVIRARGTTPPDLGSAPGTGPVAVTSTYTRTEAAALRWASTLFRSDPPTVQRTGVAFLASLVERAGR